MGMTGSSADGEGINAVYQKTPQSGPIYSNSIFWEEGQPKPASEGLIPRIMLDKGNYRTEEISKTGHLRTFLRKRYIKIDGRDFVDEDTSTSGSRMPPCTTRSWN